MTILAEVLLTGLTLAFVLYPFFRREQALEPAEDERLDELRSKRDTTYAMLKEIEFDRQSGALAEKDYRELEARYQQEASDILKEMDHLTGASDVNEEIEKSVKKLRQGKQGKSRFCGQCGAPVTAGDRFCPRCGKSLAR